MKLSGRRSVPSTGQVRILAQRDGVVLAAKPAALATEMTPHGERALVGELAALLDVPRLHAASRLDVGVSGVVLCTVGRAAARRVEQWREAGTLKRQYLAIAAEGDGRSQDEGVWDVPLGKVTDRAGRHKASPQARDRRPARTCFRVIARGGKAVLLSLLPQTGRMHQLRAHAAWAGIPIYGDRRYGGPGRAVDDTGKVHELDRIALHALRVETPAVAATAPMPETLKSMWRLLGGDPNVWRLLDDAVLE